MWLEDDIEAAIEWQEYRDSLCVGCGGPKVETFDPANDDRYDVTVLRCHSCAAKERKAQVIQANRDPDAPAPVGLYLVTKLED